MRDAVRETWPRTVHSKKLHMHARFQPPSEKTGMTANSKSEFPICVRYLRRVFTRKLPRGCFRRHKGSIKLKAFRP